MYTLDSVWRNRAEFIQGREEIVRFLMRKWQRELDCVVVTGVTAAVHALFTRWKLVDELWPLPLLLLGLISLVSCSLWLIFF